MGNPLKQPSSFLSASVIGTLALQGPQCMEVFWSAEEHTPQEVAHYLSQIPHLDWSQPVYILSLLSILLPSVSCLHVIQMMSQCMT